MNFKARFFFFFFFHFFFFFAPPSLPSKNRNSGPVAEKEVDVHLFSQLCDSSFVLFLFFFPILSDVVDNVPLSVSTGGHWPPPSPWSFTAETIAIDAHQHCDRRNLERKKKGNANRRRSSRRIFDRHRPIQTNKSVPWWRKIQYSFIKSGLLVGCFF